MKKHYFVFFLLLSSLITKAQNNKCWTLVNESAINKNLFLNRYQPRAYQLFQLNATELKNQLMNAVVLSDEYRIITVPNPNGGVDTYKVKEHAAMDPQLAARYPEIKSYMGNCNEDPSSIIYLDFSPEGFHGMILSSSKKTVYIDPLSQDNYYVVFSRDGANEQSKFNCLTKKFTSENIPDPSMNVMQRGADDGKLRTYRLALACTGEYGSYFLNGTETTIAQRKAKVLAAMNTLVVRTNGIFERDFGIHMNLIANNDAIIYLTATTDPWTTEWNTKTQQTIDAVIGSANYDIGHLVHKESTAANNNGNAGCIACVCTAGSKGSGFTSHVSPQGDPFVVDYTAHEMGHQFGANHTFTFGDEPGTASQFEPGSGSTIMGYAGITGATDVQPHSDDYFHTRSIEQVTIYTKGTTGGSCAIVTTTGNAPPTANAGGNFTIPKSTAFALTGTGVDANAGDVLSYTWEQIDAGTSATTMPSAFATSGPAFRSRNNGTSPTRIFPVLSSILDGTNGNLWERIPSVARVLHFRFTVKDNHAGGGNNQTADANVTISAASGPFTVTAPNTIVTYPGGSSQTITWSVASTTAAPVSCANVKISLSTDGGLTFPIILSASTPNDGTEILTIPNTATTTARIKIEAVGNIFFDISNTNFTITASAGCNAPVGLTASAITNTTSTIAWSAVTGAVSYNADYKLSSATVWTNLLTASTARTVNLSALTQGTLYNYRVRTNCSSGSSTYTTAQFTTLSATACASAFEPNQTINTAVAIANNTNISAAIGSATDTDYYKITTTSTSNININLTALPADYDLYFYNSAGTLLGSSLNASATNETITVNNQPAGIYYVKVFGFSSAFNATICYTLNAGVTVASSACKSTYDNAVNATVTGAPAIPFNTNITGLISPAADIDLYKFVITRAGTITATLTSLPADYDLSILNSTGATVLASSSNTSTTSEAINYTAAAGTYYIKVAGYSNANNPSLCYTLKVQLGTAAKQNIILFAGDKDNLKLFPNPAHDLLDIAFKNEISHNSSLIIIDMKGIKVFEQKFLNNHQVIDISKLAKGIYLIKINNAGKVITEKFIKQ